MAQTPGLMTPHEETFRTHGAERLRYARRTLKVATYNVRTLYQAGKFHQLCSGSELVALDFIAVQEHRWVTNDEVDYQWDTNRKYMLAYSSADARRQGGVGLLISKSHVETLKW